MVEPARSPFPGASAHVLLGTKLYVPSPRPNLVPRERLLRQLDWGLSARLILVSGPAGFGKTTLISDWLRARPLRVCWLSLDEADNDPATFLLYLVAAVRTLVPDFASDLVAPLSSPQPPPVEAVLPPLANHLRAISEEIILVLDDYHTITAPAVSGALEFLLDGLPPRFHIVVATRSDPPLPLARLRSRGQLLEIRTDNLRFSAEEALEFLTGRMGLPLSPAQVAALEERTEGWIAGLQMAALSMRGRPDIEGFVSAFTGSHRYILDFLAEEVLAREPEDVQSFLLQTSVLERLCGPLCDAVTDGEDGQAMLERLERANLFLVPLDDERRWYRYHHLFRDLLRTRLAESQPELAPLLRSRAAEWCHGEGLVTDAMDYLLSIQAYERAATLAEQTQLEMHSRSDPGFFLKVPSLPDEATGKRPWLSAFRAMLDIVWGRLEEAERWIHEAEAHDQGPGITPDSGELTPFLWVLRAYIEQLGGRDSDMTEAAAEALELLSESKPSLRNSVLYWLAMCHFLHGDFKAAEETWTRLVQQDVSTGATNAIASAIARVVMIRMIQGRLLDAAEMCREWLTWLDERGRWRFFLAGHISETLGDIQRQWNNLDDALALIERGISESRGWRNPHATAFGYVSRARVLFSMGSIEDAASTLEEAGRLVRGLSLQPDVQSELSACWVQLHLARGDLRAAARWVNENMLRDGRPLGFRQERDGIALARLLLARGEHPGALALLGRLEGSARLEGRIGRLIEILTLQSLAYQAQRDAARGLSVLGQALTLAEPEGYVRVFVDEGEPVAVLLAKLASLPAPSAAAPRFSPDYVTRLLDAFASTPTHHSSLITHHSSLMTHHPLVEPLSEREVEVLRLIAEGLTNQQIAARLVIAPGTVRAHVHNISGKLGAQNRTQAVARATELRLL